MSDAFWSLSEDEVLTKLDVDKGSGLTAKEAQNRLRIYGKNVLIGKKQTGSVALFFSQLKSPLIYMLLFAAMLSLVLYDKTDAIIIFGIVFASATLSFFQEKGALNSMEKLLKIIQIKTEVLRDSTFEEISIENVVPGDIISFKAGDVVPADCYLLQAQDLFVDEATLTGETFYAEKRVGTQAVDAPIAKRFNTLFMGTHVVSGKAVAVAVVTGKESQFGQISDHLRIKAPETDFEHGVRRFGYFLGEVTLLLLVVIFACNVYLGRSAIESMLFALALSVGLTPQLLPAIISVTLAQGAKSMAKKKVIVKRLASIENFGSMNLFCADKTGTLTTSEIRLDKAVGVGGDESSDVLLYAALNATFQTGYNNSIDQALTKVSPPEVKLWQKLDEIPYDFIRKRVSVLVRNNDRMLMSTKGAFEQIVECCAYVEKANGGKVAIATMIESLKEQFTRYSNEGFRVLGLAIKDMGTQTLLQHSDEHDMTFVGFLLFWNPPKENILETIQGLEKLGISLKIITGDNKLVTQYIAKKIGIEHERILTGAEISRMSDRALIHQARRTSLFVEVEPNQKERIILALRKGGYAVGFMGDGINDVTALHAADVSISVDSAVDAAKEVADIVLLENNLSILTEGVLAGRKTFANTLKYIFMSTSANFGNMFSMAGASLFLSFLPLLPKQVLLTNLLTDCPEMTIATDSVDKEMLEKPLRWNVPFIRRFMLIFGLISSIFDYITFGVLLWLDATVEQFRTGWFVESVVSATLIVLVVRTFRPFYLSMPSRYLLSSCMAIIAFTVLLSFLPVATYLGFTTLPVSYYGFLA